MKPNPSSPMAGLGPPTSAFTHEEVSGGGERVTHLYPNDCYYAHLSIYYFATQFCHGGNVLDAGSGSGYGSNYLAEHGALSVNALELSEASVLFSRLHFSKPILQYHVMDLQSVTGFQNRSFDLIYSSNVLEHVPDVARFLRAASLLLRPGGIMLVAVPPIVREIDWAENIANLFHLNIWTPRQWHQVLSQYFSEIDCYWHGLRPGLPLDFNNTPEKTVINEESFVFRPIPIEHYYSEPSLTVIFVLHNPRREQALPLLGQPLAFIEQSFSRPLPAQGAPTEASPDPEPEAPTRRPLAHLLGRVRTIARDRGLLALFPAALRHVRWRLSRRTL